ncbi:hypothetical protein ALI22I_30750 [Saccharothrix sp. ALI-22-I]|uniref:hypothetical protein n=1 Tax=Saccharothrix sp. ALI-22-I TaxID=1933778 RepID=UPI00097BEBDD|nr:hypothetical protein [Saccharothrix sp. ALI-22-I]ONI84859.1 hypothetical protein ALI22I_30750 [Saccharothrix sp. ALI-22-I]
MSTLVRNVLLAEPLVGDFGRCFTGGGPDEAEALAVDFASPRACRGWRWPTSSASAPDTGERPDRTALVPTRRRAVQVVILDP